MKLQDFQNKFYETWKRAFNIRFNTEPSQEMIDEIYAVSKRCFDGIQTIQFSGKSIYNKQKLFEDTCKNALYIYDMIIENLFETGSVEEFMNFSSRANKIITRFSELKPSTFQIRTNSGTWKTFCDFILYILYQEKASREDVLIALEQGTNAIIRSDVETWKEMDAILKNYLDELKKNATEDEKKILDNIKLMDIAKRFSGIFAILPENFSITTELLLGKSVSEISKSKMYALMSGSLKRKVDSIAKLASKFPNLRVNMSVKDNIDLIQTSSTIFSLFSPMLVENVSENLVDVARKAFNIDAEKMTIHTMDKLKEAGFDIDNLYNFKNISSIFVVGRILKFLAKKDKASKARIDNMVANIKSLLNLNFETSDIFTLFQNNINFFFAENEYVEKTLNKIMQISNDAARQKALSKFLRAKRDIQVPESEKIRLPKHYPKNKDDKKEAKENESQEVLKIERPVGINGYLKEKVAKALDKGVPASLIKDLISSVNRRIDSNDFANAILRNNSQILESDANDKNEEIEIAVEESPIEEPKHEEDAKILVEDEPKHEEKAPRIIEKMIEKPLVKEEPKSREPEQKGSVLDQIYDEIYNVLTAHQTIERANNSISTLLTPTKVSFKGAQSLVQEFIKSKEYSDTKAMGLVKDIEKCIRELEAQRKDLKVQIKKDEFEYQMFIQRKNSRDVANKKEIEGTLSHIEELEKLIEKCDNKTKQLIQLDYNGILDLMAKLDEANEFSSDRAKINSELLPEMLKNTLKENYLRQLISGLVELKQEIKDQLIAGHNQ